MQKVASRREMGFADQAGAALVLVILTLWLQCAGMGVLIFWTKTFIEESARRLSVWRSALLMVRFAAAMTVLQMFEILLWAGFYRWKCFPSWGTSFYFSTTSYTTVGYGDVLLPHIWHRWLPCAAGEARQKPHRLALKYGPNRPG